MLRGGGGPKGSKILSFPFLLGPYFSLLGLLFSLLGASWPHFAHFVAFVVVLGQFCSPFGTLRARFYRVWEPFWEVWGAPGLYFYEVLDACALAVRTESEYTKTYEKPRFWLGFQHIARVARDEENDVKSFLEPVGHSLPQGSCSKRGLGLAGLHFGRVWGSLWRLLGVTWPAFGRSWAAHGPSCAHLSCLLGA